MLKHPVLASMGISAVTCVVAIGLMLSGAGSVDEKPFIIFFGLLGFPFLWFILWIVVNGIAWGAEMKHGPEKDE